MYSIVIPNFNGAALLKENLPKVLAAMDHFITTGQLSPEHNLLEAELIVVDDGSSDDSVAVMKQFFPGIKIIEHVINQGFSAAVLSGVTASHNPRIILLNSDVAPQHDFIAPLLSAFDPVNTFAVSPLILDEHGKPLDVSWTRNTLRNGKLVARRWSLPEAQRRIENGQPIYHLFASGGSAAFDREKFLALGGFHPIYKPFYYEDMDLGIRAWRKGWRVQFRPDSCVLHPQGSTIKSHHKRRHIKTIMQRNRLLLQWLHLPRGQVLSYSLRLALRYLEHLLRFDLIAIKGLSSALGKLPTVLRGRSELRKDYQYDLSEVIDQIECLNRN